MRQRLWVRRYYEAVYETDITILVGPRTQLERWLQRRGGSTTTRSSAAKTIRHEWPNGLVEFYIWFKHWPTKPTAAAIATVAHEAIHLSSQILRCHNITLCEETEEAHAYLHAHLVAVLLTFLTRSNRRR